MKFLGGELRQGDCLKEMKRIRDHSIGMILCDLPYGTTQNRWDSVIPLNELWHEYRRIIKPKGVIALTSQGLFTARLILSNEAWFRYKFVWVKSKSTNWLNARRQPLRQHEDICIFYNQQPEYQPVMWNSDPYDKGIRKDQYTGSYGDFRPSHVKSAGERFPTDALYCKTAESETGGRVWHPTQKPVAKDQYTGSYEDFRPSHVKSAGERFPTDALYCKTAESEAGGRVWHPTQKPVALGRYLIRMFTKPGDIVLDNAFGSGSFLVAAAMEKRKYFGIEKNEEVHLFKKERINYVNIAWQRLEEVRNMMLEGTDPPPLFSDLQPSARSGPPNESCMVDVNDLLAQTIGV